jgi:LDH2 family malate/lactate/ureidoglycolate dehydrogenase
LCVAILCGTLNGSDVGKSLTGWGWKEGEPGDMGHFLIAVDPAAFGERTQFAKRVRAHADAIRSSRKAPGVTRLRVPGERAAEERRRNRAHDRLPLYDFVWEEMAKVAKEIGVTPPAVGAA